MDYRKSHRNLKVWWMLSGFFFVGFSSAQVQEKTIAAVRDTIVLDSISVAAVSVEVKCNGNSLVANRDYFFVRNYTSIVLVSPVYCDTLFVKYQTLPDWLLREKRHRQPNISASALATINGSNSDLGGTESAEETIHTDGTLLRGLSFGNAQDLVLSSSLNLRMHGKVGKDIEVEGAVTDQEFPFQPEGTTTTLQDFDRIYVAVHMPRVSVLLGDYAFQSASGSRFMKYAKKNRGLQLYGVDTLKHAVLKWEAAAALARGRFSRNEINGVEGLQGPYRLSGSRGEQFVIVVSGTEVVYLDGKKMERGLQADYVIDYNTGEITFTPRNIITAFSRIIAEFQYSDRFYTRSVVGTNATLERKKATHYVGIYSEQDARNQPIQQDLLAVDSTSGLTAREILQNAGDNAALAYLPGARKLQQFSSSEPNYIQRDTGVVFYEYVAEPDTHKLFYRVNFTFVGAGKGTYVVTGSTANGKVYRYVGVISGVPAGDYEPVSPIQPPNRLTMAEMGTVWRPRKETVITGNLSLSSNDRNLFSPIGDKDNKGAAAHFSVSDKRYFLKKDSLKPWYILNKIQGEQTTANFVSIERYRDVEFGREWNRNLYNPENGLDPRGSRFANGSTEVGNGKNFAVYAGLGYNKTGALTANNGKAGTRLQYKRLFSEPRLEWTNATNAGTKNQFQRQLADLGYRKEQNSVVLQWQQESSLFSGVTGEKLDQSYGFRQLGLVLNKQWKRWSTSISGYERTNTQLRQSGLTDAARGRNVAGEISGRSKKSAFLKLGISYRDMLLLDTFFRTKFATEDHMAGRLEYNFTGLLKSFSGNVFYQSISAREQQRQYSYFEVPAGQGFYTWVDFNGNNVKEVNEFQETPFKDQATYIRLLVPTGTYLKAQGTEFTGNLLFRPKLQIKQKKKGTFLNRLTWNYNGKSTATDWLNRLTPFIENGNAAHIIAFNSYWRNLTEYETQNGKWMVQYNVQKRGAKLYFTNGFDIRTSFGQQFFVRGNIGSQWQLKLGLEKRNSKYLSEYVPANNFFYEMYAAEPAITFQPGSRFRVSLMAKAAWYENALIEIAQLMETGIQGNKAVGKSGMMELKLSYLDARYMDTKGTAMAYDILQGFSSGKNIRGVLDLRFNAAKNIQMFISYEARKTADVKLIHIGRAEARYLF